MRDYTAKPLNGLIALSLGLFLSACAEREEILPGPRFDLREGLEVTVDTAEEAAALAADGEGVEPVAFAAPAETALTEWTHKNGAATHLAGHAAFSAAPARVWSSPAGAAARTKKVISANPIVADGRVFIQDPDATLIAFDPNGTQLWSRSLIPDFENEGNASGGGIAFGAGLLVATTGYGEVIALDPTNGDIEWRHRLAASVSSAPAVSDDLIVVVSRDNIATALDPANGRILWEQQSTGSNAGISGGGSPALRGKIAVLPFTNGDLVTVLTRNGQRVWSAALTGTELGSVQGALTDISSDPVMDGRRVYAGNQSGQLAALDRRNGSQIWSVEIGSHNPVWPAAGSVFVLSETSELMRLDAADGSTIWSVELPHFENERRRRETYAHFGPILAGGRLWVASSDGLLRGYDPETGSPVFSVEIPGGAASAPALADGQMYIQSANGQLHAYQ